MINLVFLLFFLALKLLAFDEDENAKNQQAVQFTLQICEMFKKRQLKPPSELVEKLRAIKLSSNEEQISALIIQKKLSIQQTMLELKEGLLSIEDLPCEFFSYVSSEQFDYRTFFFHQKCYVTPLRWLMRNADDPYFYRLLTNSRFTKELLASINDEDEHMLTPLRFAIILGGHAAKVTKFLLESGADPNGGVNLGFKNDCPLGLAVQRADLATVKLLVDAGAKLEYINNINISYNNDEEKLKYLVRCGVIICALNIASAPSFLNTFYSREDQLPGENWLYGAIRHDYSHIVEYMFKETPHADLDALVNQQDVQGLTPLDIAVVLGRTELIYLLLRYGADPACCYGDILHVAEHRPHWCRADNSGSQLSLYEQLKAAMHKK